MDMTKRTTEIESLKTRLRATWIAGDFGEIARSYQDGAAEFVSRLGIERGDGVLDVACGTGNLALPAACAGAAVSGLDIAPNLIEQAKLNASAEGLAIRFEVGDVEAMPYRDSSFDVVMTMFGGMFAPRPELVTDELVRVCRPGGRIAMANWTAEGFIGKMFKTIGKYLPPPAMPSPLLWGSEDAVKDRFDGKTSDLKLTRREIELAFPFGASETVEHFRKFYGPMQKAFDALAEEVQFDLRADLESLWSKANTGTDGTTRVQPEYLEVIATTLS